MSFTEQLKQTAYELGFCLVGVCPAVSTPGYGRFREWLEKGYAGEMNYLPDRAEAYAHPRSILEGVRSVLMLGMNYRTVPEAAAAAGEGKVAAYAWGSRDYHDLIRERLKALRAFVEQRYPESCNRGVVDTAPLLERDYAQLAGLGWMGKNTLLLNRHFGSWFFLAALLTDLDLAPDVPFESDHCGSCTACLDSCPTQAFPQPYVLDATRCISYLTIELRGETPTLLRDDVGDWLFGCDVCQTVCPWNHKSPSASEAAFSPTDDKYPVELRALFGLTDEQFRARFRHTPLWRSKRQGILRNAAIVLGNQRAESAVPALRIGLDDADAVVRDACAWALSKIDTRAARAALAATREQPSSEEGA